ncbi:MAG TPA: phospholipase D-like domain-containing protein [Methylomirabilota bacterium]|nr:phospholipase D-like domain-containing protein [Methylomirabilota bacterium]
MTRLAILLITTVTALALLVSGVRAQIPRLPEPEQSRPWAAYFSPNGGATQAVVEALGRATQTVLVQAVTVSSPPIVKALIDAHQRGVKVEVILERSSARARYTAAAALAQAGIVTLIDGAHHAASNNVMVIDGQVVLTGGFTFTTAAERDNAENLLVIHAPGLATRYGDNWKLHAAHSTRFVAR